MPAARVMRLAVLSLAAFALGCWHEPVTAEDRDLLVEAHEFAALGFPVAEGSEAYDKKRKLFGSTQIRYDYRAGQDAAQPLHTTTLFTHAPSPLEADLAYRTTLAVIEAKQPEGSLIDVPGGLVWGESSVHRTVFRGREPIGTLFLGRREDKMFMFVTRGVYFENGEVLARVLKPALVAAASY